MRLAQLLNPLSKPRFNEAILIFAESMSAADRCAVGDSPVPESDNRHILSKARRVNNGDLSG
jgi:hypothetical protein